jgi:hypothetical protein
MDVVGDDGEEGGIIVITSTAAPAAAVFDLGLFPSRTTSHSVLSTRLRDHTAA